MTPRPDILPAKQWAFPLPEVTGFDNGMTLWTYDLPGQLILSCGLVLELPLNAEPVGHDGVATIAVRTLDEGTVCHPGSEFSAALEEAGAQFSGLVGLSTTQCLLDLPYDSLDPALALFAEAVTTPAYDEQDVARIMANRLAEIEQQESRGSFQASAALRKTILSGTCRAARPAGGTWQTVSGLTPADVSAFHHAHYRAEGATLIIAGDLREVDALGAAQRAFGGWHPTGVPTVPEVACAGTPSHQLIHRDGAVQADIRIGWFGIDRKDPRWAGLQVALAIMGGMFTSRLNTRLREERGYTYGVSMTSHPYRSAGFIDVATSTRSATAPDLVAQALELLEAGEPFTDDEVASAIGYLTLSAPLTFDTAETVASQAASLAAARLDLDHVTRSLADIRRVSADAAMEAYRSLIDPRTASIVVVGDTEQIGDMGW